MPAAGGFEHPVFHVRGVVFAFQAARARCRPGPVIGVVQPAAFRVQQIRRLVHFQQALVFGGRVASVHWFGPVKRGIAPRNIVAMEISDVALRRGEQSIVGGIRHQFHRLFVRLVVARPSAKVRLRQRLHRLLHDAETDPLAVFLADHRAMGSAVDSEFPFRHSIARFIRDGDLPGHYGAHFAAVFVEPLSVLLFHRLGIFVDGIKAAGGVHPTHFVIEALVKEELTPGCRPIGIQAFLAHHLQFRTEEERGVRVDQQQGTVIFGIGGRNGNAVGTARLLRLAGINRLGPAHRAFSVQFFQLRQIDFFDIAANTSFAETERHPRLKMADDARLYRGVPGQIKIQPIGPGGHQFLQPRRALAIQFFHLHRINE